MPDRRKKQKKRSSQSALSRNLRSEEHTSELQSQSNLVCRLLLEKKKPVRQTSAWCECKNNRRSALPLFFLLLLFRLPRFLHLLLSLDLTRCRCLVRNRKQ